MKRYFLMQIVAPCANRRGYVIRRVDESMADWEDKINTPDRVLALSQLERLLSRKGLLTKERRHWLRSQVLFGRKLEFTEKF